MEEMKEEIFRKEKDKGEIENNKRQWKEIKSLRKILCPVLITQNKISQKKIFYPVNNFTKF